MGMTDRQFDEFLATMLLVLKSALKESPDNEILKTYIEQVEAGLKRP